MERKKTPHRAHDALYKKFFSDQAMVESLLRDYVSDRFAVEFDFSTLTREPASYVTDDLRERHSDIVWRVQFHPKAEGEKQKEREKEGTKREAQWFYLYLLIEFQSTVDALMALRMLSYTSLLLIDIGQKKRGLRQKYLPPVFPLVIYTGKGKWTARQLEDFFPPNLGILKKYQPNQEYFVLDETLFCGEDGTTKTGLASLLLRLEKVKKQEDFSELAALIMQEVQKPQYAYAKSIFYELIRVTLDTLRAENAATSATGSEDSDGDIHELQNMMEGFTMLADSLREIAKKSYVEGMELGMAEGKAEGKAEGMELGKAEGMQALLLGLASRRWGAVSSTVEEQLRQITDTNVLENISFTLHSAVSRADFETQFAMQAHEFEKKQ